MNRFAPKVTDEIRATIIQRVANLSGRTQKSRDAAAYLFFTCGIYPSAGVVRECIGLGSVTDVNEDLRGFWEDLRARGAVKIDAPMLPEPVGRLFSEALGKVWGLALAEAHATLAAERQEMTVAMAQVQALAENEVRSRKLAELRVESLNVERRQEQERREAAERRVEAQAAEIDGLQTALAQWQSQAQTEAQARKAAEGLFSKELAEGRAARQRDAEVFEGEIKFVKMQIESARTIERDLRDQLKIERSDKEAELLAMRQRNAQAEETLGRTRIELAELKGRFEEVQARLLALAKERRRSASPVLQRRRK